MKPICLNYWTALQEVKNLGDYITSYLFQKFGLPFVSYDSPGHPPFGFQWHDTFRGAMTILLPCSGTFWGTGYAGPHQNASPAALGINANWLACRGPYTRDRLCLPAETPLGDPCMLLPYLIPKPKMQDEGSVTYIPHCLFERDILSKGLYSGPFPADRHLSMWIRPHEFELRVKEIASSRMVLTGSLHAYLIAMAYGVPAQIELMPGETLNLPNKWQDAHWLYENWDKLDPAAFVDALPYTINPRVRALLPSHESPSNLPA